FPALCGKVRRRSQSTNGVGKMQNDDMKKKSLDSTALSKLDGFDGYTDEFEGGDQDQGQFLGARIIQGICISFTNEAIWVDAAKQALPADLELIVIDVARVVTKWGKDGKPIQSETRILAPGEKFPNIKVMNENCPKSEWQERFGKLEGPFQAQHATYLL